MIATRNLSKVFRTEEVETTALNNVTLTIERGEFVSVMGPSGCGKSTLLHLLGLLDNPSGGEYELLGREVSRYSERRRADLASSRCVSRRSRACPTRRSAGPRTSTPDGEA